MKKNALLAGATLLSFIALVGFIASCGSSTASNTYVASSNAGDLATWTVNGNDFSVVWKVTNSTGDIQKTLNISGTCAAEDSDFKFRSCTVATGTCTDGTQTCGTSDAPSAGDVFKMLEVPGTAIMVKTPDDSQLHVGVVGGSCSAFSGDYSFIRTGLNNQGIFGMYRLGSAFDSVTHADFKFTSGASMTVSTDYSDSNGVVAFSNATCADGVYTATTNGNTIRFTNTASGLFLIDLPSGSGGIISGKTSNAAALSDFSGKTLYGVSFPDNSSPVLINVTFGTSTASVAPITAVNTLVNGAAQAQSVTSNDGIYALKDFTADSPAGPNFNVSPTGGQNYNTNALATTYAKIQDMPGLFWIKTTDPAPPRGIVMMATKNSDGKVLAFGAVVNNRSGNNENTGNFLLFEK